MDAKIFFGLSVGAILMAGVAAREFYDQTQLMIEKIFNLKAYREKAEEQSSQVESTMSEEHQIQVQLKECKNWKSVDGELRVFAMYQCLWNCKALVVHTDSPETISPDDRVEIEVILPKDPLRYKEDIVVWLRLPKGKKRITLSEKGPYSGCDIIKISNDITINKRRLTPLTTKNMNYDLITFNSFEEVRNIRNEIYDEMRKIRKLCYREILPDKAEIDTYYVTRRQLEDRWKASTLREIFFTIQHFDKVNGLYRDSLNDYSNWGDLNCRPGFWYWMQRVFGYTVKNEEIAIYADFYAPIQELEAQQVMSWNNFFFSWIPFFSSGIYPWTSPYLKPRTKENNFKIPDIVITSAPLSTAT